MSTMKFDKQKYRVYTWKNWAMLHWILNPALAINELILGQRVPKISLEDKTIDKPRIERSFVPCPHCETLHDSRTWATANGTCRNCGNTIPCLTNWLSFLILAITSPIWYWFRKSLRAKWLAKQPERYENIDIEHVPNPFGEKNWIKTGLSWGAFMFIFMEIGFRSFQGKEITGRSLLVGIVLWTISGLIFGYVMKLLTNSKGKKKTSAV